MPITLDIPPALVQEAKAFAESHNTTIERMLVECLEREVIHARASTDWKSRFMELVKETSVRRNAPYHFNRADAYAEAMS